MYWTVEISTVSYGSEMGIKCVWEVESRDVWNNVVIIIIIIIKIILYYIMEKNVLKWDVACGKND